MGGVDWGLCFLTFNQTLSVPVIKSEVAIFLLTITQNSPRYFGAQKAYTYWPDSGIFPTLFLQKIMPVFQCSVRLPAYARGFHLITQQVEQALPQLSGIQAGILYGFIQHTSASLSINENADPTVRHDFESFFNRLVPEKEPYFRHNYEGDDDMPAHLKAALLGHSVTIPIRNGRLALGTWQGIYLGEHRDAGGPRTLILTVLGD